MKKVFCVILTFLLGYVTNDLMSQTCCNGDTIYFENHVDCPICLEIQCFDPSSNSTGPVLAEIENDSPGINNLLYVSCPSGGCSRYLINYVLCGGDSIPQTGQIVLQNNACASCPAFRINLTKVNTNALVPPLVVYTSNGPN